MTYISIYHGCTCVPHPEPHSHLPPHTITLGHPSAPGPSFLYPALNLDWRLISYMILYMFQLHSPKSFHPLPLPQSPKDCSIHLCLFCCLAYRVVITIFLNSAQVQTASQLNSTKKFREELTPILLKLFRKLQRKVNFQTHLWGHHHPSTKTWQRCHKKRKLQANITDEHRCKNP